MLHLMILILILRGRHITLLHGFDFDCELRDGSLIGSWAYIKRRGVFLPWSLVRVI